MKSGGKDRSYEKTSRRYKQLLDDLKETRRYWQLQKDLLGSTMWGTRFGRGYGPVIRQTNE